MVCKSTGRGKDDAHSSMRRSALRQVWVKNESWEEQQLTDLPPLEDIEDNGVFVISRASGDNGERLPPPVGTVEIEGTTTDALIDTWATVRRRLFGGLIYTMPPTI